MRFTKIISSREFTGSKPNRRPDQKWKPRRSSSHRRGLATHADWCECCRGAVLRSNFIHLRHCFFHSLSLTPFSKRFVACLRRYSVIDITRFYKRILSLRSAYSFKEKTVEVIYIVGRWPRASACPLDSNIRVVRTSTPRLPQIFCPAHGCRHIFLWMDDQHLTPCHESCRCQWWTSRLLPCGAFHSARRTSTWLYLWRPGGQEVGLPRQQALVHTCPDSKRRPAPVGRFAGDRCRCCLRPRPPCTVLLIVRHYKCVRCSHCLHVVHTCCCPMKHE